jgi:hypothetical protein
MHPTCPCWRIASLTIWAEWEVVVRWANHFVGRDMPTSLVTGMAVIIGKILESAETPLLNQILSCDSTSHLLLRLWNGADREQASHPMICRENGYCPVPYVLYIALVTSPSICPIHEILTLDSEIRTSLLQAATGRIATTVTLARQRPSLATFVVRDIKLTATMMERCPKEHCDWIRIFGHGRFLKTLFQGLSSVVSGGIREGIWVEVVKVLELLIPLVFQAGADTVSPVLKLVDALEGGALDLIAGSLAFAPIQSAEYNTAISILDKIGRYMPYLDILPIVNRFENTVPEALVLRAMSRSSKAYTAYEHFTTALQSTLDCRPLWPEQPVLSTCDYQGVSPSLSDILSRS